MDGDEDEESGGKKKKGFTLIYDVARRFAQPLGIHLEDWEGRTIEIKKGIVRLLPIGERAKQLFGEEGMQTVAAELERGSRESLQMGLFPDVKDRDTPKVRGRLGRVRASSETSDREMRTRWEPTTLDHVHAAMLLQASGRANALRALLETEQERGPIFCVWRTRFRRFVLKIVRKNGSWMRCCWQFLEFLGGRVTFPCLPPKMVAGFSKYQRCTGE